MSSSAWIVESYGNPEMVADVIRVVSSIFVGESAISSNLLRLAALFALVLASAKSFFSLNLETLFASFARVTAVSMICMSATSTVLVEDSLVDGAGEIHKIDRVPTIFAATASILTRFGSAATKELEKRLHHVQDGTQYSRTARIWGADVIEEGEKWAVLDPCLRENLEEIGNNCVRHGLAVGHYTLDQLRAAPDILCFLEENAPKIFLMKIWDPKTKCKKHVECAEGIAEVRQQLETAIGKLSFFNRSNKQETAKISTLKKAVDVWEAIPELSAVSSDMIKQQVAFQAIRCGFNGHDWAIARAQQQEQAQRSITAALSPRNVIAFRAVLECIGYIMFVFVIILGFFPSGIRRFVEWLKFFGWLQLMPVTYVIVAYFFDYPDRIALSHTGCSIENLEAIRFWYGDIRLQAGALMAVVPFLSYIMFFGSPAQMVHLAGSIFAPTSQAASSAAAEFVSGNYSYQNSSVGNISSGNETWSQVNRAPLLQEGFNRFSNGEYTETRTEGGSTIMQMHDSQFRGGISFDSSFTNSLSHQIGDETAKSLQFGEALSDSFSNQASTGYALAEHYSELNTHLNSNSLGAGGDNSEHARALKSTTQSFAERHNISNDLAFRALLSCSSQGNLFGKAFQCLSGISGSLSAELGQNSSKILEDAKNVANSHEFSESFGSFKNWARSEASNSSNDKVQRLAEDWNSSDAAVKSYAESYNESLSKVDRISRSLNFLEQQGSHWQESLSQPFADWGADRYGSAHAFATILKDPKCSIEAKTEFLDAWVERLSNRDFGVADLSSMSIDDRKLESNSLSMPNRNGNFSERLASLSDRDISQMEIDFRTRSQQEVETVAREQEFNQKAKGSLKNEKGENYIDHTFKDLKSKHRGAVNVPKYARDAVEAVQSAFQKKEDPAMEKLLSHPKFFT